MAYRMEYTNGTVQRTQVLPHKSRKGKSSLKMIIFIILICLLLYNANYSNLWSKLNLGNPAVTRSAAEKFTDEIQNGTPFRDAFTVFCKEIINGD